MTYHASFTNRQNFLNSSAKSPSVRRLAFFPRGFLHLSSQGDFDDGNSWIRAVKIPVRSSGRVALDKFAAFDRV